MESTTILVIMMMGAAKMSSILAEANLANMLPNVASSISAFKEPALEKSKFFEGR